MWRLCCCWMGQPPLARVHSSRLCASGGHEVACGGLALPQLVEVAARDVRLLCADPVPSSAPRTRPILFSRGTPEPALSNEAVTSRATIDPARLPKRRAMTARHGEARLGYRHDAELWLLFDQERVRSWALVGGALSSLWHRGLEPREIGREERWRDAATKVVVMMRRHTAPAHTKGGEGLNLCICMVLRTLERMLGMGGEGLNPLQWHQAHT